MTNHQIEARLCMNLTQKHLRRLLPLQTIGRTVLSMWSQRDTHQAMTFLGVRRMGDELQIDFQVGTCRVHLTESTVTVVATSPEDLPSAEHLATEIVACLMQYVQVRLDHLLASCPNSLIS